MNKCEKCGFMHYRTDPCRKKPVVVVMHDQRMAKLSPERLEQFAGVQGNLTPKPKRSDNRHRPGYFTEYMRGYRARLKDVPKPKIERDNDRR